MSCGQLALALSVLIATAPPPILGQAIRQEEGKTLIPPNFIETGDSSGISVPIGFGIPSLPSIAFSATIEADYQTLDASGQSKLERRTLKIARDSKGRTRIDTDLNVLGAPTDMRLLTVHIYDPVAKCEITLFPQNNSALRLQYKTYPAPRPKFPLYTTDAEPDGFPGGFGEGKPLPPTPDIRREELGTQVIDGMQLRHGRETTHYPAGYANQKDADTAVADYWYSQELQSFVLVKQVGPHNSVNTLRVRDIRHENPAPYLFAIPTNYKVTKQIMKEYKPT
jgi:hypothetical protein